MPAVARLCPPLRRRIRRARSFWQSSRPCRPGRRAPHNLLKHLHQEMASELRLRSRHCRRLARALWRGPATTLSPASRDRPASPPFTIPTCPSQPRTQAPRTVSSRTACLRAWAGRRASSPCCRVRPRRASWGRPRSQSSSSTRRRSASRPTPACAAPWRRSSRGPCAGPWKASRRSCAPRSTECGARSATSWRNCRSTRRWYSARPLPRRCERAAPPTRRRWRWSGAER
mmetsp:Transcript_71645/g.207486  ORF Transcript_71645/g.207486 Transcript_71645/m.207486 type:complete len:230 (-) Transcript_71645:757-1446(-)